MDREQDLLAGHKDFCPSCGYGKERSVRPMRQDLERLCRE
jgi:ribosomal protein L37E